MYPDIFTQLNLKPREVKVYDRYGTDWYILDLTDAEFMVLILLLHPYNTPSSHIVLLTNMFTHKIVDAYFI